MRKLITALAFTSIFLVGLVAAPVLYAHDNHDSSGSMMSNGMMGNGNEGGMMGMMTMMKQMSHMMDHCNNMMSDSRPNEQWRKNAPSQPEKKG